MSAIVVDLSAGNLSSTSADQRTFVEQHDVEGGIGPGRLDLADLIDVEQRREIDAGAGCLYEGRADHGLESLIEAARVGRGDHCLRASVALLQPRTPIRLSH